MATSKIEYVSSESGTLTALNSNDIDISYFRVGKMVCFSGKIYTRNSGWDVATDLPKSRLSQVYAGMCDNSSPITVINTDGYETARIQIRDSSTWSSTNHYIFGVYISA